jgi:cytochrome c oxidase subunit IV
MAEEIDLPADGRSTNVATHGATVGHVVPARVLVGVWAILLVLTAATVSVTWYDFGAGPNLWIAMGIATVKASLVLLYFMHLRYDRPVNAIVFIFALFFVALFIAGALQDSQHYQADLIRGYAPAMAP